MSEVSNEQFVEVYNDVDNYRRLKDVAERLGISERHVRRKAKELRSEGVFLFNRAKLNQSNNKEMPADAEYTTEEQSVAVEVFDEEMVTENVKLAKKVQRAQDVNRIERKSFREHVRIENAVSIFSEEIANLLKQHKFKAKAKHKNKVGTGKVGIIHWSDQHLNERVMLPYNRYDWQIAAKRLKKHVDMVRQYAKVYGINQLLVAMTGDMLNSDRRIDELLANAGNRAKACVLAVDLYQQALRDLQSDFDLTVAAVSGNESRIPKDVGWEPEVASDNYDFTIYEMLRLMMDSEGINFVKHYDPNEIVVNMNGQHVLLVHGHASMATSCEKAVLQIKGKWAAKGVQIDMVIWGHMHNAYISDQYARSSSLVGPNDYSDKALNLNGRASQNFYILHETGGFDGVKIDLQNTDGVEGYDLEERLECYNTKAAEQLHHEEVIVKVVI